MSNIAITARQQADEIKLIGIERATHVANIRRAGRTAEADLAELRLPKLRAAYQTLDQIARNKGE